LNLVTLLIYQDNWRQASEVVSRAGLSSEQFASAQARAEQLKTKVKAKPAKPDQVATANNPQQPSIK
jgi:uncharacterized protein YlxW (UPF0749 family)